MTVLRSESRATLKWCLSKETFTQTQAVEETGCLQMTASRQFRSFESLNLIKRVGTNGRAVLWAIDDEELAIRLANEKPKPRNGYTPVAQRPVRRMVNSVFQLGAMSAG